MAIASLLPRSVCLGVLLSVSSFAGISACGGAADSSDDGSADLSADRTKKDAGKEDAGKEDAGKDAAADAGKDASVDAGKDAAADAGQDAGAPDTGAPPTGGSSLTLVTEPDDGFSKIYALVAAATSTVDMTMYELVDTTMTSALTAAVKRGVTVRVILDQNEEKSNNTTAYNALAAAGAQVHWANPTFTVTHQKTLTVDSTTSAIMTANLTSRYYSSDRDFLLLTNDANDIAAIEKTFGDDFTNTSITPPTGDDLVWSPTNSSASILALIGGASESLLVENEEMSDSAVVSALTAAAKRGVTVKVVMTDSSSYSSEFKTLVAGGVKLVTYASSASLYIHAKIILADYGTSSASAFLGSENFSTTSLGANRELGLILSDPTVLSGLETTLSSDYAGGTAY